MFNFKFLCWFLFLNKSIYSIFISFLIRFLLLTIKCKFCIVFSHIHFFNRYLYNIFFILISTNKKTYFIFFPFVHYPCQLQVYCTPCTLAVQCYHPQRLCTRAQNPLSPEIFADFKSLQHLLPFPNQYSPFPSFLSLSS